MWNQSTAFVCISKLGPWEVTGPDAGFPKLRWAQAGYVGYIPHTEEEGDFDYSNIYMAVAADLPDFDSPVGS